MDQLIQAYNEAEIKWMSLNKLYSLRIAYLFNIPTLSREWQAIEADQEKLDVAIYFLVPSKDIAQTQACVDLIAGISRKSAVLSQQMLADINAAAPA